MYAVDYEYRSDQGPRLVGPFATKAAGHRYADQVRDAAMATAGHWDASYEVVPLHVPEAV